MGAIAPIVKASCEAEHIEGEEWIFWLIMVLHQNRSMELDRLGEIDHAFRPAVAACKVYGKVAKYDVRTWVPWRTKVQGLSIEVDRFLEIRHVSCSLVAVVKTA